MARMTRSLVILFLFLGGCNTFEDTVYRGKGTLVEYEATYEEAFKVIPFAANHVGLSVAGVHELFEGTTGIIFLERGMSFWSYGEKVCVFVDEKSTNSVCIEIVCKPYYKLNITATDFEEPLHDRISTELFLLRMSE